jgi:organic radical activating enzyme
MQVTSTKPFYIKELEISITHLCTLSCANCGFLVPHQPKPSHGEPVAEISTSLERLYQIGIRVKSLAILGGEPTIDGRLLEKAIAKIASTGITERIEVVTNGLTPHGLTKESLNHIDRLSISVYGLGETILERYRLWLQLVANHVELVFRRSDEGWDPWISNHKVSEEQAQKMFNTCWYRRHCTTVERGHLFACSRIAKLGRDNEGLPIQPETSLEDVDAYLNGTHALPSCATCTPMMGLGMVPAGVQPDNRIYRLEKKAVEWLEAEIRNVSKKIK